MTALVIAEHGNGELKAATNVAVAAASKLGVAIDVLVAGSNVGSIADSASKLDGVSTVKVIDSEELANQLAQPMTSAVVGACSGYTHIFAANTTNGKDVMPRVAAALGVAQISDIVEVVDEQTFKRPIYAGNAIATVRSSDSVKVVTVRGTAFEPVSASGSASKEDLTISIESGQVKFVGEEIAKSERPELTSAGIIISGGRGMQNGDNFKLLEGIADKLNGAIGASRAAVDAGFVPNDMQVGQTGKIVAPDLYVAVGISGAIQHLAGMKDSKVIVAINKDVDAPIFQVADYGLVADLFEALPAFEAQL